MGLLIQLAALMLALQAHAGLVTKPVPSYDEEYQSSKCTTGRDYISCRHNGVETVIRDIKQPLTLVAGESFQCVLTVDRVRCFVEHVYHPDWVTEVEVPALKNPRQISGGGSNVCALDDLGMHCWSYAIYNSMPVKKPVLMQTPELKNPRMIAAGRSLFCAIDDRGAKCWRPADRFENSMLGLYLERIKNPTRIGVSEAMVCLTDETKWACYENESELLAPQARTWEVVHIRRDFAAFAARPVVDKRHPEFNLDQIDYLTDLLITISPPAQTRFFASVAESAMKTQFDHTTVNQSRYLMLRLMEPAIQSNSSNYFVAKFLPAFNKSLASIEQELGAQNISRIPRSDKNREAALRIMHSALTVFLEFTPVTGKQSLAHLPRLIGQAIVNPQNVPALNDALDQVTPQLQQMEQNPKAAFLVQIVRLGAEWLKGN